MMESVGVSSHPARKDAAVLSFKERYMAEKFLGQAKDIPHIGAVELSWMANQNIAAPSTFSAAPASASNTFANGNGGDKDIKMEEAHDVGRAEVDYDVADDDDRWLMD